MADGASMMESLRKWVVENKLRTVGCIWLSGIGSSIAYNWSRPNMKTSVKIIHAREDPKPRRKEGEEEEEKCRREQLLLDHRRNFAGIPPDHHRSTTRRPRDAGALPDAGATSEFCPTPEFYPTPE
ncbi:hypothetical protein IEQ34_010220 [Dendrobium chrysotoxum]|uniref:HIG1 domain-containing protein n=1 Tax=Dendrobium chrysotoxum TaxID=161865 RepID=A0AAV7GLB7_DENCH|nr:hypothetical protein IEQ34_010220 [Dendrobium chrysotoxum]